MILYLIRHGEPDYETDTLTEQGWKEARALSVRLCRSGMDELHASPMGRARQTGEPTAEKLGLPIITEPWAYEMEEECATPYPDGIPKGINYLPVTYLHAPENRGLTTGEAIVRMPGLNDSGFPTRYTELAEGLDGMLRKLGYSRNEKGFYDVTAPNDKHVALFCHAAMQRALLAHLFHLPFQLLGATLYTHYTGITCVYFDNKMPETVPELFCYGDVGHLFDGKETVRHYMFDTAF